jgi:hypothetical protein
LIKNTVYLIFSALSLFLFLVMKTLDPQDQTNMDPKHCLCLYPPVKVIVFYLTLLFCLSALFDIREGELFGRLELNAELSDESAAGKLMLTKCQAVLLLPLLPTPDTRHQ